jgi:hypothetical protein
MSIASFPNRDLPAAPASLAATLWWTGLVGISILLGAVAVA